ncbi:PD-(D/E)XK nuclease family protein [Actinosynnema sp. NPDC020468]|uniref:PD-(D/E)XK nuclease family protein n=1 Tax=Actinosynnema sp. NPDC020468 TaxID=3154488 RepID=UPI0033F5D1A4
MKRIPEVLEHFTNGPFMDVLDLVEHARLSIEDATARIDARRQTRGVLHDGLRRWTEHAVTGYLAAFSDHLDMRPVRRRWMYDFRLAAPDARGAERYQITVWGRCYTSADGRLRELRLVVNRVRARARTEAEIAVAALVLASADGDVVPEHVRIRQFGILEGEFDTLFDGSRQAALDLYQVAGRVALAEIVDGKRDGPDHVSYRPGTACVDCPFSATCRALVRVPGLLGLDSPRRPRRSWSPTSARSYSVCPARQHMRTHRLPADGALEHSPAAERGRAVHRYLEAKHSGLNAAPCTPYVPRDWVPDGYELSETDRELGAQLVRQHSEVCALSIASGHGAVRVEPDLVYEDANANVVVLVKPDLLYRDGREWIWREVKTSVWERRQVPNWFATYPQLALAVVLVARGALGGGGRVELEVLRPKGVELITFDPYTPQVRAAAEQAVLDHVHPWHADNLFAAAPGKHCGTCEVSRWCSFRDESAVEKR